MVTRKVEIAHGGYGARGRGRELELPAPPTELNDQRKRLSAGWVRNIGQSERAVVIRVRRDEGVARNVGSALGTGPCRIALGHGLHRAVGYVDEDIGNGVGAQTGPGRLAREHASGERGRRAIRARRLVLAEPPTRMSADTGNRGPAARVGSVAITALQQVAAPIGRRATGKAQRATGGGRTEVDRSPVGRDINAAAALIGATPAAILHA